MSWGVWYLPDGQWEPQFAASSILAPDISAVCQKMHFQIERAIVLRAP